MDFLAHIPGWLFWSFWVALWLLWAYARHSAPSQQRVALENLDKPNGFDLDSLDSKESGHVRARARVLRAQSPAVA